MAEARNCTLVPAPLNPADFLTHKKIKNSGKLPQYYVEDDHECCPYVNTFAPPQKARKLRRASRKARRAQGKEPDCGEGPPGTEEGREAGGAGKRMNQIHTDRGLPSAAFCRFGLPVATIFRESE